MSESNNPMNRIIEEIILNETRNHGLNTSALIQFLALKGIIDINEFEQYLDAFSLAYVKRSYPELFE